MQQAVLVLAAGTTCLAARTHRLTVSNVPRWVPVKRLLGDGGWRADGDAWTAELTTRDACDVAASIRGVGLDGRKLLLEATPKLPRPAVRAARLEDARRRPVQKSNLSARRLLDGAPESLVAHRRRRTTSPGFTRRGARVDAEGKWSLTPERLANEIADKVPAGSSVFDCCCGCGGNAIAFARRCAVTAIDVSSDRVALARRNAKIYGVDVRIDVGDALRDERTADVLFVDAPWGREWDKERTDLDSLPLLRDVLAAAPGRFKRLLAKVPPSFATAAVPGAAAEAFFGHESGDARRVKFVLLDLVL